jgi:hypothetical protein
MARAAVPTAARCAPARRSATAVRRAVTAATQPPTAAPAASRPSVPAPPLPMSPVTEAAGPTAKFALGRASAIAVRHKATAGVQLAIAAPDARPALARAAVGAGAYRPTGNAAPRMARRARARHLETVAPLTVSVAARRITAAPAASRPSAPAPPLPMSLAMADAVPMGRPAPVLPLGPVVPPAATVAARLITALLGANLASALATLGAGASRLMETVVPRTERLVQALGLAHVVRLAVTAAARQIIVVLGASPASGLAAAVAVASRPTDNVVLRTERPAPGPAWVTAAPPVATAAARRIIALLGASQASARVAAEATPSRPMASADRTARHASAPPLALAARAGATAVAQRTTVARDG